MQAAFVELAVSTTWGVEGIRFEADPNVLTAGASISSQVVSADEVEDIRSAHRRAVKRLQRDSTSPGAQATLGVVLLASAALTGGVGADPLSQAVGSFIGTHFMGLSGAAATSAGLAWLGGGSLAAGGFGMAGGTFLIAHVASMAARQGTGLAVKLASVSSRAFISELAKLDVTLGRGGVGYGEVLAGLRELEPELRAAHATALEAEGGARPWRVLSVLGDAVIKRERLSILSRDLKREMAKSESSQLAASRRAIEYEIRHLTSAKWKRNAQKGARLLGVPSASKLFDKL
jgi:hypothetical protein